MEIRNGLAVANEQPMKAMKSTTATTTMTTAAMPSMKPTTSGMSHPTGIATLSLKNHYDPAFRYYSMPNETKKAHPGNNYPDGEEGEWEWSGAALNKNRKVMATQCVEVRYSLTGTRVLRVYLNEPMTCDELMNRMHNLVARELQAPRLAVKLTFIPVDLTNMAVNVSLVQLHSWVEAWDREYDEQLDPSSDFWKKKECGNPHRCLFCGDPAIDVDTENMKHWPDGPFLTGDEYCERCCPCACCENCAMTIGGEHVCVGCVAEDGIQDLTDGQKRWLSFFRDTSQHEP